MFGCCAFALLFTCIHVNAQTDTIRVKNEEQKSDRNMMLNASSNTGPRNVNIGLPASVGGTTVLENNIPVVYYFWPQMPTKLWRQDAMTNGFEVLDMSQTALRVGDLGFSVGTIDNLGTDEFQGNGFINSNHYGLIRNSLNVSGTVSEKAKGLKYSVGSYISFDPGTFKPAQINRYHADQTQLYKAALTQDYNESWGKGSISVLYKYANSKGLFQNYSPFIYNTDGKVDEIKDFKMGKKSYYERSGRIDLMNAFTGEIEERDIIRDYGAQSHTIDLIGKNKLSNGLDINYIMRYNTARSGLFLPIMTGVDEQQKGSPAKYQYEDGTAYHGDAQGVMVLASRKTPTKTFLSLFEVGKKSGNHEWKVGFNEWYYSIDRFATESTMYYQEVAPDPRRLKMANASSPYFANNAGLEYHNGHENKMAIFVMDKWDVLPVLTLTAGTRLEYQAVRGDYQNKANLNPATGAPYTTLDGPKTKISDDWFNKTFTLNAVYKATARFGVLGEFMYNEQGGHLENYSSGNDPNLKKSKIPEFGLGVYYNHPLVSLVSKGTYIKRDEYRSTVNFSDPNNPGNVQRVMTNYSIETIGWTTDAIVKPFKGFDLHLLLTIQAPKYKDFNITDPFANKEYNFSNNIVTGISKVLIEIDPSYTYRNLRLWASARYFSKEYMNKTNSLHFAARWETFAGLNYKVNKYLDLNCTVVNLLNQRGASGSIGDADLIDSSNLASVLNSDGKKVMSGTYIRPFTVEFGLNFRF